MNIDDIQSILREILNHADNVDDVGDMVCQQGPVCTWMLLKLILCLLTNKKFGLKEIKCEIKDIERKLDGTVGGSLSTGPFFVRSGQNNAINVKVQNVGEDPIDAVVRLFDMFQCPPVLVDEETLSDIGGGCCAQNAVLTANAGDFEVVICPDPADATIRAFVSVHSGNAPTAAIDYVIKASEMLPVVCDFCGGVID